MTENENLSWESYTVYECPECGNTVTESFVESTIKYSDYYKCEKEFMKCENCEKEFIIH